MRLFWTLSEEGHNLPRSHRFKNKRLAAAPAVSRLLWHNVCMALKPEGLNRSAARLE